MLSLHVCVNGDSGVILSDNAVNFNGVLDFVVFTKSAVKKKLKPNLSAVRIFVSWVSPK